MRQVYELARTWYWKTLTKRDFLQTLYKMYLKNGSSIIIAESFFDVFISCTERQLEGMFLNEWRYEDWPHKYVKHGDFVMRAGMKELFRQIDCIVKDDPVRVRTLRRMVSEEWNAARRRTAEIGGK
jgi:hypothetical protein